MIRNKKTIGSSISWAKLKLFATATIGLVAASLSAYGQAIPGSLSETFVESRSGGKNFAKYSEDISGFPNSWANSGVKSTATGTTPIATVGGVRFNSNSGVGGANVWFQVNPTLPTAGGLYRVYITIPSGGSAGSAVTSTITTTGGTGLPATTTAFSAGSENTWKLVGTLQLNPGVTAPTVRFSETANNGRFIADTVLFAEIPPCALVASVTPAGPLAAGNTSVTVTGVSGTATDVTVYANDVQIGTVSSPVVVSGSVTVPTSALVKDAVIKATQTVGGLEGCAPSTVATVGGGSNPTFHLALSIRTNSANVGPIGAQGLTGGALYFLGSTAGTLANGPADGFNVVPSGCWQTVTLQSGVDPAVVWSGAGPFPATGFAVLDGIAIKMNTTDTGPYEIYIDDLQNGSTIIQDWETNLVGASGITFKEPRTSGTTSGDLLAAPNVSVITGAEAFGGTNSLRVQWQSADLAADNWLRLTTDGAQTAPAIRRPQVDLSQPISFRILVLPVGQSSSNGKIASQPLDAEQIVGEDVSFSVAMSSADPIYTYQWSKIGTGPLAGKTDSTLLLTAISQGDAGEYSVEVTVGGSCPSVVNSRVATLTVPVTPVASIVGVSSGNAGDDIILTGSATGGGTMSYAWYKDLDPTPIATTAVLTLNDVLKASAGTYKFQATNLAGTDDETIVVTVTDPSPASIVANPGAAIGAGTNLTLTATSIGTGTLTYEWRQNGAVIVEGNVTGADSNVLTITGATAANAGSYHVIVSNAELDSTPSDPIAISVLEAPVIVADLAPESRNVGQTIVYSVTTTGSAATFAWKKDNVAVDELDPRVTIVSDSNSSSLTITSLGTSDEADYSVTASNLAGEDSSSSHLTVIGNVAITDQPDSLTVGTGTNALFSVGATGGDLTYQWKLDGNNVGANSSSLSLNLDTAGTYAVTVVVSNPIDITGVISDVATLTVIAPPTISSITADQILTAGDDATLEATLGGSAADTTEWTFNAAVVSSGTTHELTDVTVADMGTYTFTAVNFAGEVTASVEVTVNQAPTIDVQPATQTVAQGANVTFNVVATGNPLNYQWMFNGEDIAGETTSSLAINNVQTPNLGYYSVRIYNDLDTVVSDSAVLNVSGITHLFDNFDGYANQAAFLAAWPQVGATASGTLTTAQAVSAPNSVGYAITAQRNERSFPETGAVVGANKVIVSVDMYDGDSSASPYRQYINLQDNVAVSGGWLISLGLNNNQLNAANGGNYYMARILNYNPATHGETGGTSGSYFKLNDGGAATLRRTGWVNLKAEISDVDIKFYVDGILAKTVATTAAANLSYDLVRLGSGLSSTIAANFDNISVTGAPFAPLTITSQPQDTTVNVSTTAEFSVVAASSSPLNYQWQKDGVNIANATTATLTLNNVQTSDQGSYRVIVFNDAGPVTSDAASLTVIDPADLTAPVLKVLAPKANFPYVSSSLLMTGTVLDAVGVASVEYSLNGGDLTPVDELVFVAVGKASNWISSLTLAPGTNLVTVVATDRVGQQSTVGPITFYYHTASPLTIVKTLNGDTDLGTNHVGTVVNTIPLSLYSGNNTNLFVGRTYTLKVVEDGLPKFGFILTNWTATWDGQASPVVLQTNNLACTFEMKEGMVLKANFIDNPFVRFGGTYLGLFSDTNGVAFHSAGYAQIKVTPKMAFSAKLLVDGNPVAIAGKLKIDGTGSATSKARFKVTDKPELTVDLALDFANGSDSLSGTVSEGLTWSSELLAYRLVWSKTNVLEQAQEFTNNYTMQVPGFATLAEGPVGTGSAAVKVDVYGKVVASGVGSDMHLMKQSTYVSEEGQWPFFSPMYKVKRFNLLGKLITETRGFAMGWLQFATNGLGNYRPEGEVHTIKTGWVNDLYTPGWTNTVYEGGFTNAAEVVASRWSYDALAPQNALPITGVVIDFLDGDLGSSFSGEWAVTVKSTFAPIKDNVYPNTVKAALVPKTGVFRGTFIHPSNSALTKYQGVMLQDGVAGSGAGTFIGPDNGGKVTVSEAPVAP